MQTCEYRVGSDGPRCQLAIGHCGAHEWSSTREMELKGLCLRSELNAAVAAARADERGLMKCGHPKACCTLCADPDYGPADSGAHLCTVCAEIANVRREYEKA